MECSRKVLVTGATGNVGQAVSSQFSAQGWQVERWSRQGAADTYALDLADWNAPFYALERRSEAYDTCVMAHGFQEPRAIANLSSALWETIITANLSSCAALTSALIRYDKLKDNSLLIYCSSLQAYTPRAGRSAYAAAKAGLEAFAKTAAQELAPRTRVIVLRLGQLTNTMAGVTFSNDEQARLAERALVPWVAPADVARLCLELYEQKSLTGCVLDIDSGQGRNVW